MTASDKNPNRLDELFTDLGKASLQLPPEDKTPTGWTWKSGPDGDYVTCSPEVEAILGYAPEEIQGKSLTEFALPPEEQIDFRKALQGNTFPVEITLHFQTRQGKRIPVSVHIMQATPEGESWRGFNQVVSQPKQQVPPPPPPPQQAVQKSKLRPAFQENQTYHFSTTPVTSTGKKSLLEKKPVVQPSTMAIPVQLSEEQMGLLELIDHAERDWSQDEKQLVEEVAYQLSLALENALLFQQTETQAWELEVLNNMGQELSALLDIDDILQTVYKHTSQLMDTTNFYVAFYQADQERITFPLAIEQNATLEIPPIRKTKGLTQHVIDTQKPLLISRNIESVIQDLDLDNIIVGEPTKSWLGVPMLIGEEVIGIISLQNTDFEEVFTPHDQDLLLSIARQAAISIQNARLFNQTQEALNETQTLLNISSTASQALILENAIQEILGQITNVTEIDVSLVSLVNNNTGNLELTASENLPKPLEDQLQQQGMEGSLCHLVFTQQEARCFSPLENVPEGMDVSSLLENGFTAYLGIPIVVKGETIGTISSFSYQEDVNLDESTTLLQAIAQHMGVVIENTSLFEEIQQRSQELTLINRVVSRVAGTLDLEDCLDIVANEVGKAFKFQTGIALLNEQGTALKIISSYSPNPDRPDTTGIEIPISGNPSTERVFETKQPVLIQDAQRDPLTKPIHDLMKKHGVFSLAIFPIISQNRVIGTLGVDILEQERSFTEEELQTVETIITQAATAVENVRLYQEQKKTAERLREVDKLKSQFLANMSHELRTPLNSIIGFSRVILKGIDGPVTDLQQQDLTAIYESGQHLLNMINDILDISKIEAGKMELSFEEVDLTEMVNSVLSTAVGLVKDKPIELRQEIEDDLPLAWADPVRVRQVLLNFFSNAAKFTEEGHITVTTKALSPDEVYIAVSDTGQGISEEDQKKLFQRFSQVDSSTTRKAGGTGLGLSISQQLIKMQGGEIGVESEPGEGSTFYFTLPTVISSEEFPTRPDGKAILAIDDDPQILDLYDQYLSHSEYHIFPITESDQVMSYIRELKPNMIALDVLFGEEEGWRILKDIKKDPELQSIPVIVCSLLEDKERAQEMGADAYLNKPILESDLITTIENLENEH